MIVPPHNLTLTAFLGSEGHWVPYALTPPGPSPITCDPNWEWMVIQNGKLYVKPFRKTQFRHEFTMEGAAK